MNALLITIHEIAKYKDIATQTNNEKKVNPAIREAQEWDVRPVLGEQLYLDLLANIDADYGIYKDLVEGAMYVYDGRQFQVEGVKVMLAYYAYARLLPSLGENATPTGYVQKTNQYSQPVSEKSLSARVAEVRAIAEAMRSRIIDYLNRNQTTFPLWYGARDKASTGGLRVSPVGGKNKIGGSHRCRHCGRYSCNCNRNYNR